MSDKQSGVGRTEPMCSLPVVTDPVLSPAIDSPPLDPFRVMFESTLAGMARMETRIEDIDRRLPPRQTPRPEPEPPYGRPSSRPLETPLPFTPPLAAIPVVSQTQPSTGASAGRFEGFRSNPNLVSSGSGPGGANRASTWDLPSSSHFPPFSWDLPASTRPQSTPPWSNPPVSRSQAAWDPWGNRFPDQPIQGGHTSWDTPDQRHHTSQPIADKSSGLTMKPPRFDGTNVVSWISRVQFYFDHFKLPEDHRLHYAVMLFEPSVAEWVFNYREGNPTARWNDFLDDVRRRFDPQCYVDYFGVIAKLRQTGALADYNKEFDGMLNRVRGVPELKLVTLYVEGLLQPIRNQVKFQYPPSVAAAMALAVEFDAGLEPQQPQQAPPRRTWQPREARQQAGPTGTVTATPQQGAPQTNRPGPQKGGDYAGIPVIRLTAAEKSDRTKKGLCWYCPERWSPGHVCSKTFLAYMGAEDGELKDLTEVSPPDELITTDLSHIYAMGGKPRAGSMVLQGQIGSEQVQVMVDTGSSHDFLHPRVAEKLKLPLTAIRPFRVYVGNGASLTCSFASMATELRIQQEVFSITLHILPIHGNDVVLGLDWLHSLQRVTNDFVAGTIEFIRDGEPISLKVIPAEPREVSIRAASLLLLHASDAHAFELLQLPTVSEVTGEDIMFPGDLPGPIVEVLETNKKVFQVPNGMPPARAFDHRIHLLPNSKPVNVRPYRYPYFQKTEIERQVREMLEAGIIRRSHSPFSSPVLLIRKKDGSFRFCIDYRALNAATVPDHFPIPTTDELFDELGSARIFTKLDLRAGYHQIRMHSEDVFKTAFRTHEGHFEFLVMPFGLTNAPSTFQAAMNDIFRPLLRRFVIIFFDDILIYSPSLEVHTTHLQEVLSILAKHNFFVKLSKCTFCCSTVDYLGHLIEDGNLRADPAKIEAMVAWPTPVNVKQLRGFLGLTGYYRRFIAGYASIAAPLTALLRKDAFGWSPAA